MEKPTELMTTKEVAQLFRVDPKTITRWARTGKLKCVRTLGGHRRFKRSEVENAFKEE
jgi:excisionase family DNA binding protein